MIIELTRAFCSSAGVQGHLGEVQLGCSGEEGTAHECDDSRADNGQLSQGGGDPGDA